MKTRSIVAAALTVGVIGLGADLAGAKVHGVSQAGCAHDPSDSGANHSGTNSPAGPIPRTASGGASDAGQGGMDPGPGCDTPADDSRQDL